MLFCLSDKDDFQKEEVATKNQVAFEMKSMENPKNQMIGDLYPGLNEITDAFDAFPHDLVGYFTLLKEIDAKCVYTVPYLNAYIHRFLEMDKNHPKREILLQKIRALIKELMPCLEEKMHVATIASDIANKHLRRIDQCAEMIYSNEIPEDTRIGPLHDPCMRPMEPTEVYLRKTDSRNEVLLKRRRKEEEQKGKHNKRHNGDEHKIHSPNSEQNHMHPHQHHGNARKHRDEDVEPRSSSKKSKTVKPKQNTKNITSFMNGVPSYTKQEENRKSRMDSLGSISKGVGVTRSVDHLTKVKAAKRKKQEDNTPTVAVVHVNSHATIADIATALAGSKSPVSEKLAQSTSSTKRSETKKKNRKRVNSKGEPIYCYCGQVSYGEMVGCDGEDCEKEWFHLPCTGLKEPPKGAWYCEDCKAKMRRKKALQKANRP